MLAVLNILANNHVDQKVVDLWGAVMAKGVIFLVICAIAIGVLGWRFINK